MNIKSPPAYLSVFISLAFSLLFSSSTLAVPASLSFQTKIFKPDGSPLEASSVSFRFTSVDPTGSCILYIEDFSNVNMESSSGLAVFNLGNGAKVFPAGAYTFTNIFNNIQPSFSCQGGGIFSPGVAGTDNRKIIAQFNDGSGSGWQTLPAINVNSVPFANYAGDSQKLAGYNISDFLRFAAIPTCTGSDVLTYDGSSLICTAGGSGTTADATISTKGIVQVGTGLGVSTGTISVTYGTTGTTAAVGNDSRITGAAQKSANLSDLASAGTARTNLGLGGAAVLNVGTAIGTVAAGDDSRFLAVGTTGGTVAAGNDSRITGAAQKSANLSDLASTGTARTNLGLGTSDSPTFTSVSGSTSLLSPLIYGGTAANATLTLESTPDLTKGKIILLGPLQISGGAPGLGKILTSDASGNVSWESPAATASGSSTAIFTINSDSDSAGSDGGINFQIGSTNIAQFTSAGNFNLFGSTVVGTATTNANLDVNGNLRIASSSNVATGTELSFMKNRVGTIVQNNDQLGNITFYGYNGTAYDTAAKIMSKVDGTPSASADMPGNLTFWTTPDGSVTSVERLRIASDGNIGIGETTPTAYLHLKAGTIAPGTSPLKFTAGPINTTVEDGAMEFNGTNYFLSSGGVRRAIPSGATVGQIDSTTAINNSAGNISINTDSTTGSVLVPATTTSLNATSGALVVAGGVGIGGALNVTSNIYSSANIQAGTAMYSPLIYGGTASSGNITIDSTSHATKGDVYVAPSGGRVGIGTTSPLAGVHVKNGAILADSTVSTNSFSGFIWGVDATNPLISIGWPGSTTNTNFIKSSEADNKSLEIGAANSGSGKVVLNTGNTARLTILPAGNVGIGTTSPLEKLSIDGGYLSIRTNAGALPAPTATNSLLVGYDHVNGEGRINAHSTGGDTYLSFNTSNAGVNSQRMKISSTGNVGIGTSTPTGPLHVNGGNSTTGAGTNITLQAQHSIMSGGTSYAGGNVNVTAGNGYSMGAGGNVVLTAGRGNFTGAYPGFGGVLTLTGSLTTGVSGAVTLYGGNGNNGYGNPGTISITPSTGTGAGGTLTMNGSTSAAGGNVNIVAGSSGVNANGGNIIINGGAKNGTGTNGNVLLASTLGNVGIGTTNPLKTLDVEGSGLRVTSTLGLQTVNIIKDTLYNNESNAAIAINDGTDVIGMVMGADLTNNLAYIQAIDPGTSYGRRLVLNPNAGQVGIGVTIPLAALHLKAGTAGPNTAPLKFTSGVLTTAPEDGTMEYDGTDFYVTSGGTRRTIAAASGSFTGVSAISNTSGNISLNSHTTTGSILVPATTASTSAATGALVVSGGAGIAGALNVTGAINSAASITASTSIISPLFNGGAASGGNITIDSTTHTTKGNILLAPNGGNVGIGTTDPMAGTNGDSTNSTHLTVAGKATNNSLSSGRLNLLNNRPIATVNDSVGIDFSSLNNNGADKRFAQIFSTLEGSGGAGGLGGNLSFWTKTDDASIGERMRISSAGNVGIGTPNPGAKLHVSGGGMLLDSGQTVKFNGTTSGAGLLWNDPNTSITNIDSLALLFSVYNGGYFNFRVKDVATNSVTMNFSGVDSNQNDFIHGAQVITHLSNRAVGSLSGALAFMTNDASASPSERMRITPTGEVGIGTAGPGEKLEVNGNIKATELILSSDFTLKKDIQPITDALSKVLRLDGVTYKWRKDEFPEKNFSGKQQVGLIAQDVAKIFPEVVHGVEGKLGVNYSALVAPLIEALKVQQKMIEANQNKCEGNFTELKRSVASLETENKKLKVNNEQLEKRLQRLEKLLLEKDR